MKKKDRTGVAFVQTYFIHLSDERPVKVTVSSNLIPPSPREKGLANVYNAHGLGPGENRTIDQSSSNIISSDIILNNTSHDESYP